jgi:uncharacterized protein YydD (DUF2326 family)
MILKRFYSIPERFNITFSNGLNLICADVKEKSNRKSTGNGAGKSTFLKLIDFCLLAEIEEKILASKDFEKYTFVLEVEDKEGKLYKIRRSIKSYEKIHLTEDGKEELEITLEEARANFNKLFFDLSKEEKTLSFRTLTNFIKRDEERGYSSIFSHFPMWDAYMVNAINLFLIGLNYRLPIEKQLLNSEKGAIDKTIFGLDKSLKDKEIPKKAELKSEKVLLEEQIANRQDFLSNFRVHKEYEKLEKDANSIRRLMRDLENQFFNNNIKLSEYSESLTQKMSFNLEEVSEFYKSLKINLNEEIKKDYAEVEKFHTDLINNRNTYLSEEIERLNLLNERIKKEIESLDKRKSTIMKILETHGALSEYQIIIERLDEDKKKLYEILNYIKVYDEILEYKNKKKAFIERLKENSELSEKELNEGENLIKRIIIKFEEIYKYLLDVTGLLIVGIKEKYSFNDQVFEFDVKGDKKGSPGIKRSQIFSYDLSIIISNICANRTFPRFILHDAIFNGVDKNQVTNAMNFVIEKSKEIPFQEIVTINTCDLPKEIDINKYCKLELGDKVETSLMGFRF